MSGRNFRRSDTKDKIARASQTSATPGVIKMPKIYASHPRECACGANRDHFGSIKQFKDHKDNCPAQREKDANGAGCSRELEKDAQ